MHSLGLARLFLIAILLSCTGPAPLRAAEPPQPPATVQDLAYGEVLFHFFQGDDFAALTRLQVALQRAALPHHREEAELLEGGLLLSYGLLDEAQSRFERLLHARRDPVLRNRVWLHLARLQLRREDTAAAAAALAQVDTALLSPERQDEFRLLQARVFMDQGDLQRARPLLAAVTHSPVLAAYARFNLAVALERSGDREAARALLAELGATGPGAGEDGEEILALRDRALLALGYLNLRERRPQAARRHLLRVRLDGLEAAPALLGLGWAEFAAGELQRALVPWSELRRRSVTEPAVQEVLLAIPYALTEAGAYAQAARYYEQAAESFAAERRRLTALAERIRDRGAGRLLLPPGRDDWNHDGVAARGRAWASPAPPAETADRELLALLAGESFQAVLENLRELGFLLRDLERWHRNLQAFRDMLDLRRRAYAQRLPRIEAAQARLDLGAARRQRDAFAARLAGITQAEDSLALADGEALRQLDRLAKVQALLERHAGQKGSGEGSGEESGEKLAPLREKHRLLAGVLHWRLAQAYKPRLWALRKELRALNQALERAQDSRAALERARRAAPQGFAGFAARIDALEETLAHLQARARQTLAAHEDHLQRRLLQVLEARDQRLRAFEAQARFGLARLYDLSAAREGRP